MSALAVSEVRSPPALRVRPATADDADLLLAVYAGTRTEELAVTGWTAPQLDAFIRMQFSVQDASWRAQTPGLERLVVVLDGVDAGRLYLERRPAEIRVVDIALLPAHRGRGAGTALLRTLLDEGAARNVPVRLHVERSGRARSLYTRLGFTFVSTTGVYDLLERRPPAPAPTATEARVP